MGPIDHRPGSTAVCADHAAPWPATCLIYPRVIGNFFVLYMQQTPIVCDDAASPELPFTPTLTCEHGRFLATVHVPLNGLLYYHPLLLQQTARGQVAARLVEQ